MGNRKLLMPERTCRMGNLPVRINKSRPVLSQNGSFTILSGLIDLYGLPATGSYLFIASSTATATETVAPTIGLLPMPMSPIIST